MMQKQTTDLRSEMTRGTARLAVDAPEAPFLSREDATSYGAAVKVIKSNRPSAYAVSIALGTASPDGPDGNVWRLLDGRMNRGGFWSELGD